jgi:hypothetical protein
MDKASPNPPKEKNIVSVNFSCGLFALLDFLTLKMELIDFPEMSVRNYHSTLHSISERRVMT